MQHNPLQPDLTPDPRSNFGLDLLSPNGYHSIPLDERNIMATKSLQKRQKTRTGGGGITPPYFPGYLKNT